MREAERVRIINVKLREVRKKTLVRMFWMKQGVRVYGACDCGGVCYKHGKKNNEKKIKTHTQTHTHTMRHSSHKHTY